QPIEGRAGHGQDARGLQDAGAREVARLAQERLVPERARRPDELDRPVDPPSRRPRPKLHHTLGQEVEGVRRVALTKERRTRALRSSAAAPLQLLQLLLRQQATQLRLPKKWERPVVVRDGCHRRHSVVVSFPPCPGSKRTTGGARLVCSSSKPNLLRPV